MSRAGMEEIYQHALLADAAYVDLDLQTMFDVATGELNQRNMKVALVTGGTLRDRDGNEVEVKPRGFTEEQLTAFVDRYRILAHQPNTARGAIQRRGALARRASVDAGQARRRARSACRARL